MSRRIELAASVAKDVRGLPAVDLARIREAIDRLGADPMPASSKALRGEAGWYRVRVGDYRVVYRFDAECVTIDRVQHRREVYR